MGLVEVLGRYRELRAIRNNLARDFLANPPDLFIGVDAPDFNLGLERRLKTHGIPTVHYVSPSVWAWRQYRVKTIAHSVDLMLTLFPFETAFYENHNVPVRFVGHPLADVIPMETDSGAARRQLGLPESGQVVALLPGSRMAEVKALIDPFLETAQWCAEHDKTLQFVMPLASDSTFDYARDCAARYPALKLHVVNGQAQRAMAAANAVLLASGTATLEALLLKRPMVVAYRLHPLTYWLARRLLKVPWFSLPNLLAQQRLVDEFAQKQVTSTTLGPAVMRLLDNSGRSDALRAVYNGIHQELRQNASNRAAQAVLQLTRADK
jgi:lipid-A-disaccharide synthase